MVAIKHGIERYLNCPPHIRGLSISTNPAYEMFNAVLNAKVVSLKKQRKEKIISHKPVLDAEDIAKLKNSDVLKMSNPLALLRNVWFYITLYCCRRGRKGQRNLTKKSFALTEDANGGPVSLWHIMNLQRTLQVDLTTTKASKTVVRCIKSMQKTTGIQL